ncbi:hypothetical protein SDD30_15995 [Moorella naiadis]|uniref:hypothetical protein n=1 Tax=Moorella naiadis (nom. illeg.) TaxID=3093670 RepID=UPI003D9C820E
MACIVWKPLVSGYYAYLETCLYDREKKRPKSKGVYLGSTPEKAAAKLRRLVPDEAEYSRLVAELYRKRPAGKPPQDEVGKAARELARLKGKYQNERVQAAVNAALAILEGGKNDGRDGRNETEA